MEASEERALPSLVISSEVTLLPMLEEDQVPSHKTTPSTDRSVVLLAMLGEDACPSQTATSSTQSATLAGTSPPVTAGDTTPAPPVTDSIPVDNIAVDNIPVDNIVDNIDVNDVPDVGLEMGRAAAAKKPSRFRGWKGNFESVFKRLVAANRAANNAARKEKRRKDKE